MKKLLTILLNILCVVSLVSAEDSAAKDTILYLNVNETYEWTVPSTTSFEATSAKKLNGEVAVTNCLLSDEHFLQISLDDGEDLNDFLLEYAGDTVPYRLTLDGMSNLVEKGDVVLSLLSGTNTASQELYGEITGKSRKAGLYEDMLTFIAEVKDELVTDLTDCTWVANDMVDAEALRTALGGNYTMFIDYSQGGVDFVGFRVEGSSTNIKYIHTTASGDFHTVYKSASSQWTSNDYKTIKFKNNGNLSSETLAMFIEWLSENGKITKPVIIDEVITDLTGYTWKANDEINLPAGYGADKNTIYIDGTFGESELTSMYFYNALGAENMAYMPNGPFPAYNFDANVWENEAKTVTFTSNVKTGNNGFSFDEVVSWLKANGKLSKPETITNLTGYTWNPNDNVDLDSYLQNGDLDFDVNFTFSHSGKNYNAYELIVEIHGESALEYHNVYNSDGMMVNGNDGQLGRVFVYGTMPDNHYWANYASDDVDFDDYFSTTETATELGNITFLDCSDICDSTLIEFLQGNGTLVK